MKRAFLAGLSLALIGGSSLVGNALPARAQGAGPTTASNTGQYLATLLDPVGTSQVAGSAAILRGQGAMGGGAKGSSGSGTTGTSAGAASSGDLIAVALSGLRPASKVMVRIARTACPTALGSASGSAGGSGSGSGSGSAGNGASGTGTTGGSAFTSPSTTVLPSGDAALILNTKATAAAAASGWSVTVYGVPGITAAPMGASGSSGGKSGSAGAGSASKTSTTPAAVACGALHRPGMVVALRPDPMGRGKGSGVALITMGRQLTMPVAMPRRMPGTEVVVFATGLQPAVANPEHIHSGPCGTASAVLFPLMDLLASPQGMAVQGTALFSPMPLGGMSLHVHLNNLAPDACGNLSASGAGSGATSTGSIGR